MLTEPACVSPVVCGCAQDVVGRHTEDIQSGRMSRGAPGAGEEDLLILDR